MSSLAFSPSFKTSSLSFSTNKIVKSQALFAAKKAKVAAIPLDKDGKEYWQGDWVCAGENLLVILYLSFKLNFIPISICIDNCMCI